MKIRSSPFDIDLTEHGEQYLRRLGMFLEEGLYRLDLKRNTLPQFPYSIEEASYLLVGLRYEVFANDEDSRALLKVFLGRNGVTVYEEICLALERGDLQNISLISLMKWLEAIKDVRLQLFPYLANSLFTQLRCVAQALQNRSPITIPIQPVHIEQLFQETIEKQTGYKIEGLQFGVDGFVPKTEGVNSKGLRSARLKTKIIQAAKQFLDRHPSARFVEFYGNKTDPRSEELCAVLKECLSSDVPDLETLRRWTRNLPFNRARGRSKPKR